MRLLRYISNSIYIAILVCILTASNPLANSRFVFTPHPLDLPLHSTQTGDLVFRRVSGVGSQFVDTLDQQSPFSHIGMIYIAPNGEASVLHVLPQNPDTVRLEPLSTFLKDALDFAIYRPTKEISGAATLAAQKALKWVGERQFDRDFDLRTDEKMYCTELVYKAYLEAGVDIFRGNFNIVEFPFLEIQEVIYPSLFIESGLFILVYPETEKGNTK